MTFNLKATLTLLVFFLSIHANASDYESRVENSKKDALKCSAVFYIMTMLTPYDRNFGLSVSRSSSRMLKVYTVLEFITKNNKINIGSATAARDAVAKKMATKYGDSLHDAYKTYMACRAWEKDLITYIESPKNSEAKMPLSDTYWDTANIKNEKEYYKVVAAFNSWLAIGNITATDMKKKLRQPNYRIPSN